MRKRTLTAYIPTYITFAVKGIIYLNLSVHRSSLGLTLCADLIAEDIFLTYAH
jgi:hypothetical protein